MNHRLKTASFMLLAALLLSFVPAAVAVSPASAAACDWAQFVSDVTVPDGTRYDPGQTFTKTWRLRNIGTCTWTTSYALVYDSGTQMGNNTVVGFSKNVAPGDTIDVSVDLTSPSAAGHYIGYWKFKNASGNLFGIGFNANRDWWVEINVTSSVPSGSVAFDFTNAAKDATWSSGAGGLKFPGTDGDAKGFALTRDKPNFESGVPFAKPGLLFVPQNVTNGFIQARYQAFKVEGGDTFQATIGCESGATSCYVAYRLDYEVGGVVKTFWTFRERYERLTYNANISLAPLSGQTVNFILYISAYGSPVGDRALWGNPIISRKGIVPPPPTNTPGGPTDTPTNTPVATQTVLPSACDKAQFVADVSIPDGTIIAPGATFTKVWSLKNVGTCAWSKSYQLVYFSGEKMGASASYSFSEDVPVGKTAKFSVNLTAPTAAGSYRGYWMFKNANGTLFGIGPLGNKPWWVDITVSGPTATPGGPTNTPTPTSTPGGTTGSAYDFVANYCKASWFSGAGALPCPGTEGDNKGFVLLVNNPKMETGAVDTRPALLTFPQALNTGYIQGIYPPFTVKKGDRFRATINCESGATLCWAAYELDYAVSGSNTIQKFWGPFTERYDKRFYNVDVDLSPLAGKDIKFILTVRAAGSAQQDRALWVGPYIYRPGAPSSTATPTSTTYQNTKYNFKFTVPAGGTISQQSDTSGRVDLPLVVAGTNLHEKYVQIKVTEGVTQDKCLSTDMENGGKITTVTINNIQFNLQSGQGIALSNIYDWTAYSTVQNNACIVMAFILHSVNPGVYTTPPPVFDKAKETAVIDTVMNTFNRISYP